MRPRDRDDSKMRGTWVKPLHGPEHQHEAMTSKKTMTPAPTETGLTPKRN
jgi:hypothetical protein